MRTKAHTAILRR